MQVMAVLDAWKDRFASSKGQTTVGMVSCSFEQMGEFVTIDRDDCMPYVVQSNAMVWRKEHKSEKDMQGGGGAKMSSNCEGVTAIYLGASKEKFDDKGELVRRHLEASHFPFGHDNTIDQNVKDKLRLTCFTAPPCYDKYQTQTAEGEWVVVNPYEKGWGFGEHTVGGDSACSCCVCSGEVEVKC